MKKGFSVVKAVLSVFVIGVVAGLGFTAYKYFTDPAFDFYGLMGKSLIPVALSKNVQGENADAILLYRSGDDLNTYINSLIPAEANIDIKAEDILSAVVIFKSATSAESFDGAMKIVIEFAGIEKGAYISGQLSALGAFIPIKNELIDNVLVVSISSAEDPFSGSVNDNLLLKNIPPDFLDSKVIFLADTKSFSQMEPIILPLTQILGGDNQSDSLVEKVTLMMNLSKYMAGYANFEAGNFNINMVNEFVDQAQDSADYAEIMNLLDERIVKAKEETAKADSPLKEFNAGRTGNLFTVSFNADLALIRDIYEADAQMNTRDAERKSDLDNIIAAMETYKIDFDDYPEGSMCVNEIEGMESYFFGGAAPTAPDDPRGTVSFMDEECAGGYYYSAYASGYALWAKMENEKNGNSDAFYAAPMLLKERESGPYFVLNETGATAMSGEEPEMLIDDESAAALDSAAAATPANGVSRGVQRVVE